ncbi:MAG: carboxypeptidase-like regulatory domain-containing protein, partial [Anaerolineae bacterium]
MKTIESTTGRFAFLTVLICTLVLVGCLIAPGLAFADNPPPPPPPPNTPTNTPVPPEPTDTPEPTNTPEPPTPTDTSVPTDTPLPTNTAKPTQTPSSPVGTAGPPQPTSNPNPACQSTVMGIVFDSTGGPALGATVIIEGADWSDAILTNDAGQYGFTQLCPGKASLQAFLTNGHVSQLAELDLNGRDNVQVELSVYSAGAATTIASTPQQTPATGPDMPTTGNEGWMLLGAALLAVFLLLVAGTRRAMTVRELNR